MGKVSRTLLVVVTAVLATFALAVAAAAAPDGIPGPPDQPGGGEPPVAGVVRPMTNGDSNGARAQGGPKRSNNLKYGGGAVQVAPTVYLVFWGSQWSTTDPVAKRLQDFFSGLYGAEDNWSTSTMQYCQGVANGSTSCPPGSAFITHPGSSPLAGTWFDSASPAPAGASQSQLAAEARRAASSFSSSPLGPNAQIVVVTPSGVNPQGFGTSYCAWHSYTSSPAVGTLAYTNLPYIPDAGAACGANFVNAGAAGALDGVTIVEGHEYVETITDPLINAWKDQQGEENADKCAWISPGLQGGAKNLTLGSSSYAVQGLWSNAFNNATGGCVNSYP
jgi:serine protease